MSVVGPYPSKGGAERAEADRALFQRFRDQADSVDRELLVERFLPLARSLAARYKGHSEAFDDIFQVACLGLVKAIDRYDPSQGTAFSSFAVPTIAGEIKRYYRDRTWSVRVPRDLQERALLVARARAELEGGLARSPTIREIGERLALEDEEVLDALQAHQAQYAVSLDAPPGDDEDAEASTGATLGDWDGGFARAESRADLDALLHVLPPRERIILRLRFEQDLTQEQIGERVGLSQMQVSRLLRSSLARLRTYSETRDRRAPDATTLAA
jgi:RNA polymerase sigma-B factor